VSGRWKPIVFTVAAIALFLVPVEMLLRATHLFGARLSWSRPDDVLGYRYVPHREFWDDDENDHPISGRMNSWGWRDRERPLEKPEGVRRVALLGDSQVEALQVEIDSTFWSIAGVELADRGLAVDFLNFGRASMTQTEQLLVLESDALRFAPDLVFVVFVPVNDVGDVRRATTGSRIRPFYEVAADGSLALDTSFREGRSYRIKAWMNPLKERSALVSLALERWNLWRQTRRPPLGERPNRIEGALTLCTATPDPAFAKSYRLNRILLAEIAARCKARNVPFAIVCSNWMYEAEAIAKYRAMDPSFDADFFETDLAQLADSLGAGFVGVQTAFRRDYEEHGQRLTWGHWNYRGHRVVAELLAEEVSACLAGEPR
jgi:hypothetical protein